MTVVKKRLPQSDDLGADSGAIAETLVDGNLADSFPEKTTALDLQRDTIHHQLTCSCC
jgi:hypothetical protein